MGLTVSNIICCTPAKFSPRPGNVTASVTVDLLWYSRLPVFRQPGSIRSMLASVLSGCRSAIFSLPSPSRSAATAPDSLR